MRLPFKHACLVSALAALSSGFMLVAQTAQVRGKVSPAIPHYQPVAQLQGNLEILGTDVMADVGDAWARAFKGFQPKGGLVYVSSLTTPIVKSLVDGSRPLVITSRELTHEEQGAFQAKWGYLPMRIPVCLDATIVFVHKNNPINTISLQQLDAIYSQSRLGGAKAPAVVWGDLGVKGELAKRPIHAYSRAEGTGTRTAFKDTVLLKGAFRPGVLDCDDTSALAESILTDVTGIAYGPLASWYANVKVLAVIPYGATDPRFPNQENITNSNYPLARLFFAYVNRVPGKPLDPAVNEALHFILSQEGQGAAADVGIMPGPPEFQLPAIKRLDQ
jgi:phosphate transport system substrate-binding protein